MVLIDVLFIPRCLISVIYIENNLLSGSRVAIDFLFDKPLTNNIINNNNI